MTFASASRGKGDAAAGGVAVGRVAAPHGVRGELAVQLLSDVPGRFAAGVRLLLRPAAGSSRPVVVLSSRPHITKGKQRLLVRLEGVDDRAAAEGLRGAVLEVEESAVPPPPEGSYYHFQLVGCHCADRRAGELGEVAEVLEGGGGLLLRVVGSAHELLLPFVEPYVMDVDVTGQRILWDLPEGLIEACGSAS